MTVGFSSANTATPLLNWFRLTNATAPVGSFAKLHTADPGASGATAAAAGSTTRVTFAFAAPSGNSIALTGTAPVWTNAATTETLTHISVWDAITAGNFDYSIALTASQPWVATNTFTLTGVTISIAPIAA